MKKTLHTMLTAAAFALSAQNKPMVNPPQKTDSENKDSKNAETKEENNTDSQE
ncbi:MAG: hypothetical protein MJ081_07475 [Ruminococcus sp.]|nr:hypothetical protein [Ruminococcus sp.]